MEGKTRRIDLRMSEEERETAQSLAEGCGLTLTDTVRTLLKLTRAHVEGADIRPVLVIDATSARKLARETRLWGYQLNQIAHALNRIAYYLRRDMCDGADALEELQTVEEKIDRANEGISVLQAEAQRMAAMFAVRK